MRLRGWLKLLLNGVRPFYRGSFTYFGEAVHFPFGSHLFKRVCEEGIFEYGTVRTLRALARPGTTYFDVGANIGLLAVPVLETNPEVRVISIEASPETVSYLRRTRERSSFQDRWSVVECAVGSSSRTVAFFASSPKDAAFDGLRDTGRGDTRRQVEVTMQTLDQVWKDAGAPKVSVIKMDVEGAESDVLAGASELIARDRPAIVLEWNAQNLRAYEIAPNQLLKTSRRTKYSIHALPKLFEVDSEDLLHIAMTETETFLLLPETLA